MAKVQGSWMAKLLGRWVAELVARLLATAALKIQNGKHKQRSGQQHSSPPKKYTKNNSNLIIIIIVAIGSTSALNTNVRKIKRKCRMVDLKIDFLQPFNVETL
jgi:hypothetical protein